MIYSQNRLDNNTKIIGVIGHPIKHSFSPLMHNTAFKLLDLNYLYIPFDVPLENLKNALKGMTALGISGFNVTLPHKEKISQYLNNISEEASVIGAVNTVVNENGTLSGYNTDVTGILETLRLYKDAITDSEISIIGSGGAARSLLYALIRHFRIERINVINRTIQKAESLKDYFTEKMLYKNIRTYELLPPDLVKIFKRSKLIVNTTAIGMFPDVDDTPTSIAESFTPDQIVFDVVYNPVKTKFLKLAESQGAKILTGLEMFIAQGAKSLELWTGEKMPVEKIRETLEEQLNH